MKNMTAAAISCLVGLMLIAGMASAHVVVYPKETSQGAFEKLSIRVPSEGEGSTVKVEVQIPAEATVSRVEPKAGWDYVFVKDATDKVESITWTATGGGLAATEFTDFHMSGRVSDTAESLEWKAYQTYDSGTVVAWVVAEGSDKPASVTLAKAAAAGADDHGTMEETPDAGAEDSGASDLPLYLSIAALLLGVIALFFIEEKDGLSGLPGGSERHLAGARIGIVCGIGSVFFRIFS